MGCASQPRYSARVLSYAEVEQIKVVDGRDCINPDILIGQMEEQLRLRGYAGKNPEDLATEDDRKLNSRIRVVIWSLRIGCNNPDRYK